MKRQAWTQSVPAQGAEHTAVLAPSRAGKSLLDGLDAQELASFNEWRARQAGDASKGGAVDLMQWPGWIEVAARHIKAGAAPADAGSSRPFVLLDESHQLPWPKVD